MTITIWVKPENLDEIINLISYLENGYSVSTNELGKHLQNYRFYQVQEWSQVQVSSLIYHKLSDFDA